MAILFKEMTIPVEVVEMWRRALKGYSAAAIEFGFDEYLRRGKPFMPKPMEIAQLANEYEPPAGDVAPPAGCEACRWSGWVPSQKQKGAVTRCACHANPALRTPRPEVDRMDLGDVRDQMMQRLDSKTEIPKVK